MKEADSKNKVDFVKWFSEMNKNSGNIAGGKGANLAEIYNLKVAVPPGFVVTAQAYDYFIEIAGIKQKIRELLSTINYEDTKQLDKITKNIRALIEDSEFPEEMKEEIIESYEQLDENPEDFRSKPVSDILNAAHEPTFVAVRSSATAEDLAGASFAGQQDTFLNVKGKEDLLHNIKMCFASLFTSRATYYRNKKGFKHDQVSLAVVVQKMIDSDKSGVIFSKDPSYNNENVIIEAVWGLGEGIVSGKVTPDRYVVSKDFNILEKTIADKKIALTRDSGGGKAIVKLREEKSKHQVLKDHEIEKLAEIAIKLEEHYGKPQDIEFAIEDDEIYIVQTRPITTMEKRHEEHEVRELKGEVLITGLAASPGIGSGKLRIIEDLKDLDKIKQGDILVTKMTNPDMVVTMQKAAAIVTDDGGMTAHASIVSREMGIPCVVGTHEATTLLKDGEVITVDGYTGKIYKDKVAETQQKEVKKVTAQTKTKIKVIVDLPTFAPRAAKTGIKSVGLTRIEGIIAESGKHPNYFLQKNKIEDYTEVIFNGVKEIAKYFEEIWVRTSDIRSDEFENLEGFPGYEEANPMLGLHGIRYSLKQPEILKAELKALQKVAQTGTKVGLLLPQVISVEEVAKVKEYLEEIKFNDARVGVMVETPAAVQIIGLLCDEGIDFISFGTNDLTQYILAVDRGNEKVQHLYNELHPAVLAQLAYVIRVCKRNKVETSICGQAGSKKEMVKYLVETGIDSISVNADMAAEIADYVAEIEKNSPNQKQEEEQKTEIKKVTPAMFEKNKHKEENIFEKAIDKVEEVVGEFTNNKSGEAFVLPPEVSNKLDEESEEVPVIRGAENLEKSEEQSVEQDDAVVEPQSETPFPLTDSPSNSEQDEFNHENISEHDKEHFAKTDDVPKPIEKQEENQEPEFNEDNISEHEKQEDEVLDIF